MTAIRKLLLASLAALALALPIAPIAAQQNRLAPSNHHSQPAPTYWVYYRYGDGSGPWVIYGGYTRIDQADRCAYILRTSYGYQTFTVIR